MLCSPQEHLLRVDGQSACGSFVHCVTTWHRPNIGGREVDKKERATKPTIFLTQQHSIHRQSTDMSLTHKIVALDSWVEVPPFDFDHELTVIKDGSALTRPEQLREATIAINSQVPVDEALLEYMPNLQLFAATGTGIDHIDKEAVRARGVTLCKVPAQNTGMVL